MFTRHRLGPSNKLDCPDAVGTDTFSPQCRDRVGMDGTKTRTSGGKILSSYGTAPLKPKNGLNGPPPSPALSKNVGRTLLSADFDSNFVGQNKTNGNGGGQECPPHTSRAALRGRVK